MELVYLVLVLCKFGMVGQALVKKHYFGFLWHDVRTRKLSVQNLFIFYFFKIVVAHIFKIDFTSVMCIYEGNSVLVKKRKNKLFS